MSSTIVGPSVNKHLFKVISPPEIVSEVSKLVSSSYKVLEESCSKEIIFLGSGY